MKAIYAEQSSRRLYRLLQLCLFLLLLTGCSDQQDYHAGVKTEQTPPPAAKTYEGKIIALGDSLTAGLGVDIEEAYPALLQKQLQRAGYNWQVVNSGISGETSSGALSRINWIIAQKPSVVILETGANDGMRGIPTQVIRDNITKAVHLLKQADIEVVLAGMQMLQNLGPVYTERFAAVYREVAEEQETILIPFFLEQVAGDPSLNLEDTIHPNPAGYRIVTRTVYPYVVTAIENSKRKM